MKKVSLILIAVLVLIMAGCTAKNAADKNNNISFSVSNVLFSFSK